mgnify:CR=1 FL=1
MGKRIERKVPKIGTTFVRTYKKHGDKTGKNLELKVVKKGKGVGYEYNGTVYNSPSGAARSILQCTDNGWTCWKIK